MKPFIVHYRTGGTDRSRDACCVYADTAEQAAAAALQSQRHTGTSFDILGVTEVGEHTIEPPARFEVGETYFLSYVGEPIGYDDQAKAVERGDGFVVFSIGRLPGRIAFPVTCDPDDGVERANVGPHAALSAACKRVDVCPPPPAQRR